MTYRTFSKRTNVGDAGLSHLKLLTSLETLLISGSKISPAGAKEIQRALPKLNFDEIT